MTRSYEQLINAAVERNGGKLPICPTAAGREGTIALAILNRDATPDELKDPAIINSISEKIACQDLCSECPNNEECSFVF